MEQLKSSIELLELELTSDFPQVSNLNYTPYGLDLYDCKLLPEVTGKEYRERTVTYMLIILESLGK